MNGWKIKKYKGKNSKPEKLNINFFIFILCGKLRYTKNEYGKEYNFPNLLGHRANI